MNLATKAIIIIKNKYLLQLRDKNKKISFPNTWGFFGGKMNTNETPENCIVRELKEELNVRSKIIKKEKIIINRLSNYKHFFFQIKVLDEVKDCNLTEGQALGWFSLEEIKKLKKSWEIN